MYQMKINHLAHPIIERLVARRQREYLAAPLWQGCSRSRSADPARLLPALPRSARDPESTAGSSAWVTTIPYWLHQNRCALRVGRLGFVLLVDQ